MISIYDVLKASKGIDVDDTFAELWGRKLSNAYTVATYSGTLPATLRTVEGYLESYKIYGNAVQTGTPTPENPIVPSGCGERTENLFDEVYPNLVVGQSVKYEALYVGEGQFTVSTNYPLVQTGIADLFFLSGNVSSGASTGSNGVWNEQSRTVASSNGYVTVGYRKYSNIHPLLTDYNVMLSTGSTALPYEPYGYKLPLTVNGVEYPIYLDDTPLARDEYVDSATGKIYRRTKNLSPPEEEWTDGQIGGGDGTVHPSTQIKVSPFIDVSTCETCIMEVFSAETEWAAAGYREMAFYDENKQYLGWIGGGGRQTLTPDSTERLSEFPAGTVYVRIGCSHGDQPFYPQLVSGYTPTHQFYPYLVPTDPPAPFPQIPTIAGTTVIDYNGTPKPEKVELTYRKLKGQ